MKQAQCITPPPFSPLAGHEGYFGEGGGGAYFERQELFNTPSSLYTIVAHEHTCRATRVAADFLRILGFSDVAAVSRYTP